MSNSARTSDGGDLLAVYGSLAPGENNHWVVKGLGGQWHEGSTRGYVFELTWGPAQGYLGFVPDPDGSVVDVWVLEADISERQWRDIDDFEGAGYERRMAPVTLSSGEQVVANIFVALTEID